MDKRVRVPRVVTSLQPSAGVCPAQSNGGAPSLSLSFQHQQLCLSHLDLPVSAHTRVLSFLSSPGDGPQLLLLPSRGPFVMTLQMPRPFPCHGPSRCRLLVFLSLLP